MYNITIKEGTDTKYLDSIFDDISFFNKKSDIILNLDINFTSENLVELLKIVDYAVVNYSSLISADQSKFDDHILDIIDSGRNLVLVDNLEEPETGTYKNVNEFISTCRIFGLAFSRVEKGLLVKPKQFSDLAINDFIICGEIFKRSLNIKLPSVYRPNMGLLNYTLNQNGVILNEFGELKADLAKNDSFIDAVSSLTTTEKNYIREIKTNKSTDSESTTGFCQDFCSPSILCLPYKDSIKEVVNYKYSVFDIIKNVTPDLYTTAPKELIEMLNSVGYLTLNSITDVIKNTK